MTMESVENTTMPVMNTIRISYVAFAFVLLLSNSTFAEELLDGWKAEASFSAGALLGDDEIGRDVNATGGEDLIASLDDGGAIAIRLGLHSEYIGLEGSLLFGTEQIEVENEFGVDFPNHGEVPFSISADVLVYPFGFSLFDGRLRPYVTTGIGGTLLRVDLDNISDKESYFLLTWNLGGGVKWVLDKDGGVYLDARVTNHHVFEDDPIDSFDMQSILIGIGFRF